MHPIRWSPTACVPRAFCTIREVTSRLILRNGVEWGLKGGSLKKTLRVNESTIQYESLFCGLTPVAKTRPELSLLKRVGTKSTAMSGEQHILLISSHVRCQSCVALSWGIGLLSSKTLHCPHSHEQLSGSACCHNQHVSKTSSRSLIR